MKLILAAALFAVPVSAFAQNAPEDPASVPWGDVWAETDYPNDSMSQAYCVWRARLCPLVRRAMRSGHVSDRELARIERIAHPRGYPPGDDRCTLRYQRDTGWEFWRDDEDNCPNLRKPRR